MKTCIFDIDDTLYSQQESVTKAHANLAAFAAKRYGISEEEFMRQYRAAFNRQRAQFPSLVNFHSRAVRFQLMGEMFGVVPLVDVPLLHDLFWEEHLRHMEPFPGVADFLSALHDRGVRIGTCTDMTADWQYKKLERLDLLRHFDFMVSSEEAGLEKPSPAMFDCVLSKAGCPASECVMFGDNYAKDVCGALAVGMDAVWVRPKPEQRPLHPEVRAIDSYVGLADSFFAPCGGAGLSPSPVR